MTKAIGLLFSGNMLSKILGLAREILMAKFFGTGDINGAYRIAQTGTLVPTNFLTSDSLNSAFIPLYKKYLVENKQRAATLKLCMFIFFTLVSLLIFFVLYFKSTFWIQVMAPGMSENTKAMAAELLKIMAICCPFYLCSALVNYISMAHGDYKPMSMRASFQNIGMLAGVVAAYQYNNFLFLAWGFTGSYIAFSCWVVVRARSDSLLKLPHVICMSEVKKVMKSFWLVLRPLLILPFLLQGNITLERALASFISIDAVSALDYARFITDTVVYIMSVPIAFVGLSEWSSQNSAVVREKIFRIYQWLAVLAINTSFFIYFYARDIVILLFMRGAFNEHSVAATTQMVQGMCIGLWAQVIGYIFIKALSAHLNNRQVLIVMSVALSSNVLVNLVTYQIWGAFGLGIGNSAYSLVMLIVSAIYLNLFKSLFPVILRVAAGLVLYTLTILTITNIYSLPESGIIKLSLHGIFFLLFVFFWTMLFSDYRTGIKNFIKK